jgi:ABC-type uncharacterized transport system ATPase subunit
MSSAALLDFKNVSKAFGDCVANRRVSFSVQAGTIHALVGENGAGKSTIMKILFGLYQRDSGEISLRGQPIAFASPLEAKKNGLGMVHQHFMLAGSMTALEHIFLDEAEMGSLLRPLRRGKKQQDLEILCAKYKMPVAWNEKIENLSVGFQQRIEILKLLHNRAEILILDEPTAVLTPQEVQSLFAQLRELKAAGKTILLITHKLKEVVSLADKVTVFRHGETIQSMKVSETSANQISELMVGRKLQATGSPNAAISKNIGFAIRSLSIATLKLKNIDLQIHQKEILGLAGIEGNGQSELIRFLLAPSKFLDVEGDVLIQGQSILGKSPYQLKQMGMSYFPEDRLQQGCLPGLNLKENFILGLHKSKPFQNNGIFRSNTIQAITEQQIQKFDVRPANAKMMFNNLSGGNQQKLVIARELFRKPRFLLAAQPTRGVDIGATERIHQEMRSLCDQGSSILLISSDLDELIQLSDRIVVMFQGQILGELKRGEFSEMILGRLMTGGHA